MRQSLAQDRGLLRRRLEVLFTDLGGSVDAVTLTCYRTLKADILNIVYIAHDTGIVKQALSISRSNDRPDCGAQEAPLSALVMDRLFSSRGPLRLSRF